MLTDDYETGTVPTEQRRGWLQIALVWIAIGTDVSGAFLGIDLATGMSMQDAISATLLGSAVLAVLAMAFAYVGASTGLTTAMLARAVFGKVGGIILAAALCTSMLGWFAVQAGFFGVNAREAVLDVTGIDVPAVAFTVAGGAVMVLTAIWGYRAISRLTYVVVPLLGGLLLIGVGVVITTRGFSGVQTPTETVYTIGSAASLVMGIYVLGVVTAPDFGRWARSPRQAMGAAFVGFFLGNSMMIVVAVILSSVMQLQNLVQIFFVLGLGGAAVVLLLLGPWIVNTTNIYSASLDFAAITERFPRRTVTIVGGAVGILLAATGFEQNFIPFISAMGIVITPFGGVYLAAFFGDRRSVMLASGEPRNSVNPSALVAWVAGMATALTTTDPEAGLGLGLWTVTSIPSLDGIIVAFVVYSALAFIYRRRSHASTKSIAAPEVGR